MRRRTNHTDLNSRVETSTTKPTKQTNFLGRKFQKEKSSHLWAEFIYPIWVLNGLYRSPVKTYCGVWMCAQPLSSVKCAVSWYNRIFYFLSSDYIEFKHTYPKLLPYHLANIILSFVYVATDQRYTTKCLFTCTEEKVLTMNVMWFSFYRFKCKTS